MTNETNKAANAAQQLQDRRKAAVILDAQNRIDTIHTALVVNQEHVTGRLPEALFIMHFLPFFAGEVNRQDTHQYITHWISIAGSPSSEVSIIDGAGQELYRVPALFDTSFLDILKNKGGPSFAEIQSQFGLRSAHIPIEGERYLAEALSDKWDNLSTRKPLTANEQRWLDILKRYHKEPVTTDSPVSKTTLIQDVVDDLEYD